MQQYLNIVAPVLTQLNPIPNRLGYVCDIYKKNKTQKKKIINNEKNLSKTYAYCQLTQVRCLKTKKYNKKQNKVYKKKKNNFYFSFFFCFWIFYLWIAFELYPCLDRAPISWPIVTAPVWAIMSICSTRKRNGSWQNSRVETPNTWLSRRLRLRLQVKPSQVGQAGWAMNNSRCKDLQKSQSQEEIWMRLRPGLEQLFRPYVWKPFRLSYRISPERKREREPKTLPLIPSANVWKRSRLSRVLKCLW